MFAGLDNTGENINEMKNAICADFRYFLSSLPSFLLVQSL